MRTQLRFDPVDGSILYLIVGIHLVLNIKAHSVCVKKDADIFAQKEIAHQHELVCLRV